MSSICRNGRFFWGGDTCLAGTNVVHWSAIGACDGRRVMCGHDRRRLQFELLALDLGAVVQGSSFCRLTLARWFEVPAWALDLGAVVLEPELDVLGLERREALAVRGAVELVGVLFDGVG